MPPRSSWRWRGIGEVTYEDSPAKIELSGVYASTHDVDDAVNNHLDGKGTVAVLHLQKTTEWRYENEARLISVDFDLRTDQLDKPLDGLVVGDALKAVVLGEAHEDPAWTASEVRSHTTGDVAVMQCHWTSGKPTLQVL
jgi:hypothetical protein